MARNNERAFRLIKLLWPIALALLVAAAAYGSLRWQVKDNCVTNEKQDAKLDEHEKSITVITTNLKHITKGIERIEKKLD